MIYNNYLIKHKTINVFKLINFIKLINLMIENITKYLGLAIAFNQLGFNYNVFIIYINIKVKLLLLNNTIIWKSRDYLLNTEGCLSIPNFFLMKYRFKYIVVYCFNEFNYKKFYLMNFYSCCVQHEVNHLNGILISDS